MHTKIKPVHVDVYSELCQTRCLSAYTYELRFGICH